MEASIYLYDHINPTFDSVLDSGKSHIVLKGGRSSTKSSVISLDLLCDFLGDPNGNVVCLRKVGKYLSTSVYEQIKWAILTLGFENAFVFGKQPMQLTHKETGTGFYFYGVDDPQKLKSAKIAKGYVMALWFEELAEFSGVEDIDLVEDTYIRENIGDKDVKVYFSYNPPRNPYSWVNEWAEKKAKDSSYMIHHSTYLDDEKGFISAQLLNKIAEYKQNDFDYYRWMYLGEVIGMGDNVYNMALFHPWQSIPEGEHIRGLYYAVDTGHQVSATTCLCLGLMLSGKVCLLDTYYYSPAGKLNKKAPSQLSKDLYQFIERTSGQYPAPIANRTIDSAEGGIRNQYWLDYSLRWNPVPKGKKVDMIDTVHDLLAQGRFFYLDLPSNQIFIEEHKQYSWDAKTMETANPDVLKVNDHTCDAFQYFVMDNAPVLGLRVRR